VSGLDSFDKVTAAPEMGSYDDSLPWNAYYAAHDYCMDDHGYALECASTDIYVLVMCAVLAAQSKGWPVRRAVMLAMRHINGGAK